MFCHRTSEKPSPLKSPVPTSCQLGPGLGPTALRSTSSRRKRRQPCQHVHDRIALRQLPNDHRELTAVIRTAARKSISFWSPVAIRTARQLSLGIQPPCHPQQGAASGRRSARRLLGRIERVVMSSVIRLGTVAKDSQYRSTIGRPADSPTAILSTASTTPDRGANWRRCRRRSRR
jgi:hypothetical protein